VATKKREFEHKDLKDAVKTVFSAAQKHHKALGRLVPTIDEAVALNQVGFDFICYSGDVWALQGAVSAALTEIRARTAGAKASAKPKPKARKRGK